MTNLIGLHVVPDEARDGKSMRFVSKTFHLLNVMTRSIRVAVISRPMKGAYIAPLRHTLSAPMSRGIIRGIARRVARSQLSHKIKR